MKYQLKPLAAALLSVGLMSCGGTSQDDGMVNEKDTRIGGTALDGPVAGARVFIDYNGDGVRNSFEPAAKTDSDGNFTTGADGTNYCADDATDLQKQYCLEVAAEQENVRLCTVGGYDKITLAPFDGRLCRTISVEDGGAITKVVSPLTTLVDSVSSADRAAVLDSLGMVESDLDVDYVNDMANSDGSANTNAIGLFKVAQQVVKVAAVLENRIRDNYDQVGEDASVPADVLDKVVEGIAEVIVAKTAAADGVAPDIETILSNTDDLATVLQKAENKVVEIYEEEELTLPSRITSDGAEDAGSTDKVTSAISVAADVAAIADQAIDVTAIAAAGDADAILDAASGGAKTVEVIVIKANEADDNDQGRTEAEVEAEIDAIAQDTVYVDTLATTLSEDNVDISVLVEEDLSDTDETATVLTDVVLDPEATQFSQLGGKSIRVNDPENIDASNNKHARVEFFFDSSESSNSGTFNACIKYIDGAGASEPDRADDSDLENGDTRGAAATGTWETLDENGFTTLVTLKVTEASEPIEAIVKSVGEDTYGQEKYRFDFDGGLETWLSPNGLTTMGSEFTVPTTNEACKQHFIDNKDSLQVDTTE